MKIVLIVIAVLCGAVEVFSIATGTLSPAQVLGVGVICAAAAQVVP